MRRLAAPALLLALALLAPLAAAQQTAPVLVERADEGALTAQEGEPALATFRLLNLNPEDEFYVSVAVSGPAGWKGDVDPNGFFLLPRNDTSVVVSLSPSRAPEVASEFKVTFHLQHTRTGVVTDVVKTVEVASSAPPQVFGLFANRLPAPLDNAYGTFLLEMGAWIVVGVAAIFLGDAVVRVATARASNAVTREIVGRLRKPIFYFVLFLGLARSFAILPRNPATVLVSKLLVALAVGVFGLYVLYRVLDSVLLYYQREIGPRTHTAVDDVLVPLARKVGIAVLYVVGVVVVLRQLGWDPTLVFAGAGIAGLVIAFAAQDTFSNLFSGVFLLLDRPFQEGDDIQLETGEIVRVQHIGLRTTRLYHGRNHELITVPNNQLATRRVVNLAGPDKRFWVMVDVGVAYGTDPRRVERILLDVARANPHVIDEPDWQPLVLFTRFGESSLDFTLRCAVDDFRQRFAIASELRHAIDRAFAEADVEIPFPQRTLWLKEVPPELRRTVPVAGPAAAAEADGGARQAGRGA